MSAISPVLSINLAALKENYKLLDRMSAAACETACCVKASAYGLGAKRAVPALYDAGARSFFIATIEEGVELRNLLPAARLFILNGFSHKDGKKYIEHHLIPVLNDLSEIKAYQALAQQTEEKLPAIIHFDTGMSRLGLDREDTRALIAEKSFMSGLHILYVMTHFASAEEQDNPLNQKQKQTFDEIAAHFPDAQKCLSNSGGIFLGQGYHNDLTRAGIALYGGAPMDAKPNPMNPVVTLEAPILQNRSVKKGDGIGYNSTYTFDKDGHVAVLGFGYADGFLRSLSNSGNLYWNGKPLPIRGRVSMDLTICDITHLPENERPQKGNMLEIIGENQPIDQIAKSAGTISYEILTALGNRYIRNYIG